MPATPKDGKTVRLLPVLRKLNLELTKKVSDGRKSFEAMKFDRLDEFLNSDCKMGLRVLFPISSYVQCMNTVGVKTRAELEEMWKGCYHEIVKNLSCIPSSNFVSHPHPSLHHSHNLCLLYPLTRSNSHKFSFFVSVVPLWNSLPSPVVNATSLNSFKYCLKNSFFS